MAGKKKPINWEEFEKLCFIQCTRDEICFWLDITDKTLNNRCKEQYGKPYSAVYDEKRQGGKISLRRKMFQAATNGNGNITMMIWLSKQYLKMSDKQEIGSIDDKPLKLSYSLDDEKK